MAEKIFFHNEKRKISELLPHEHNPRQMTVKQVEALRQSLQKFSLAEIPVINLNNDILAGHQRLKILAELWDGDFEIDVRVPNRQLTQKEADEYLIRSNANTGEWNFDELANYFDQEDLTSWGLEIPHLLDSLDIKDEDFLQDTEITKNKTIEIECPFCHKKFEKEK